MRSVLRFEKLRLLVRLGWGEEERRVPQPVDVSFTLAFAEPPRATQSDNLDETVCYAKLGELIRSCCERRSYNLVEKLGAEIYSALKIAAPPDCRLLVEVTKVSPPIAGLSGGVTFSFGDEPW